MPCTVMRASEAAQTVIDVIGNLALGDPEEDDDGDEGRLDPIISEGAIEVIASAFREHSFDVAVLTCGLDALCNMEGDMDAYDAMIEEGIVEACVDIVNCFDYERELTDTAVQMLSLLAESDCAVPNICKREVINTLLHAMSTRGAKQESNDEENDGGEDASASASELTMTGRVRAMTVATLGAQDADDDSAEFLKFIALTIKNICLSLIHI